MSDLFSQFDPLQGKRFQMLDENGMLLTETAALRPLELTDELIKTSYEKMLFMKMADQKANNLQRTGRMGTYASIRGQEAIQMGTGLVMGREDYLIPAFRELGIMWLHGIPMENIYAYWMGNEMGSHPPEGVNCIPISIAVGSQMLHGVGIGLGMKKKKEKKVAVTFFGDGATSEGDFHEAMNCAGLFKPNTVLICQNNQWAISVPRSSQTASTTIAQKAQAYAVPGIQVDGNDLIACYVAVKTAVDRARSGEGATLIEAYTYRLGDHTTSDDAKKYRDPAEVEMWKPRDPLIRLQKYLAGKNLWSQQYEDGLVAAYEKEIEMIVGRAQAIPYNPSDIFDYTYAQLPPQLLAQKEEFLARIQT
jgi:pyruvate dehydrogenase E1 component alpha subunit